MPNHNKQFTSLLPSFTLLSSASSSSFLPSFPLLRAKYKPYLKTRTKAMGSSIVPLLDFMPVGFRFRPTDEELVDHYLKHKLQGDDFLVQIIPDVDLCQVEPWEIPALSVIESNDREWLFFSARDYKYLKSKRFNRATKCGFWKATGKDREIKARGNVIGIKKTLVFYEHGDPHGRGVKTNWVIHEYHAVTFDVSQRTFVLCRLKDKTEKKAEGGTDALIYDEGEPSSHMASDYENRATSERIPDVGTLPEVNLESIFQAPPQAKEYDFPSIQQSPIGIEHAASFANSPFLNGYFRNENSSMPNEEEDNADEFVNSILATEDIVINEERIHALVNGSTQSDSVRRVYYESSDTDAEVVSARVKIYS